jgi:tRNA dimethylallyltransferase
MNEPSEARPERPRVVVVAGPTGAGKSSLGLRLARRFGGEVVNADSMQVYRHLDIGTAKPTPAEREAVVHHVLDVADPAEQFNAGRFAALADAALADIAARGRRAFVVGGTGLYLRALLEGLLAEAPGDRDARQSLEAELDEAAAEGDPERLHRRLRALDPDEAARIHPHDRKRTVRALELQRATGRRPSELRREHGFAERRYERLYLVVDPGREELAERIDRRCEAMIGAGLLQEVRRLREQGYGPELPSMQAIGYRHMQPVIEGRDTLAHVLEQMQHDTRQFARRQRTWFRAVPDAVWVHPDDWDGIEALVTAFFAAEAREGAAAHGA